MRKPPEQMIFCSPLDSACFTEAISVDNITQHNTESFSNYRLTISSATHNVRSQEESGAAIKLTLVSLSNITQFYAQMAAQSFVCRD